tara:strand:+ start:2103 stop:3710 length:1608 start_codon:yes stop_codon:yes gene_type:complete
MTKKKNHTTFDGHFSETMGVKPGEASSEQLEDYYSRVSGSLNNLAPLNTWFRKQRRSSLARSVSRDKELGPLADREAMLMREARNPEMSRGKVAIRGRWVSPPTEGETDESVAKGKDDYQHELELAKQRVQEAQRAGAAQGMWPNVVDTRTDPPTRLVSPMMAQRITREMSGAAEPSWSPLDLVGGSGWGAAGLGAGTATLGYGLATPQGRAMAKAGAGAVGRGVKAIGRAGSSVGVRSPLYRTAREKAARAADPRQAGDRYIADFERAFRPRGPKVQKLIPSSRRNIKVGPGGSKKQLPKDAKSATAKQRARARAARKRRDEARGKQADHTPKQKAADQQAQAAANKKSQEASINRGKPQKPKRLSKDRKGGFRSAVDRAKAPRVSDQQRAKELLPAFKKERKSLLKKLKNPKNSPEDRANLSHRIRLLDNWIMDTSAGRVPKITRKVADIAEDRFGGPPLLSSPVLKRWAKDQAYQAKAAAGKAGKPGRTKEFIHALKETKGAKRKLNIKKFKKGRAGKAEVGKGLVRARIRD